MDRTEFLAVVYTGLITYLTARTGKKPAPPVVADAPKRPEPIPPLRHGDDPWAALNTVIQALNDVQDEREEDRERFRGHYRTLSDELNIERNAAIKFREDAAAVQAALLKRLDAETVARGRLENELAAEKRERQELGARLTWVQAALVEAQTSNTMLLRDNQRLTEDNAALRKVNSDLLRINEDLRKTNREVVARNDHLQLELGELREEMDHHMELIRAGLDSGENPAA